MFEIGKNYFLKEGRVENFSSRRVKIIDVNGNLLLVEDDGRQEIYNIGHCEFHSASEINSENADSGKFNVITYLDGNTGDAYRSREFYADTDDSFAPTTAKHVKDAVASLPDHAQVIFCTPDGYTLKLDRFKMRGQQLLSFEFSVEPDPEYPS